MDKIVGGEAKLSLPHKWRSMMFLKVLILAILLAGCSQHIFRDQAILHITTDLPTTSDVVPDKPPPLPSMKGWGSAIGFSYASSPEKRLRLAIINALQNYIDANTGKFIILRSSVKETIDADLNGATEEIRDITIMESETEKKHILGYQVLKIKDERTVEGKLTWVHLAIRPGEASAVIGGSSIDRSLRNSAKAKMRNITDAIAVLLNQPAKKKDSAIFELFKLIDIPQPSVSDGETVEAVSGLCFGDVLFNEAEKLVGLYLGGCLIYDGHRVRQINQEIQTARRIEGLFEKLGYRSAPTEWLERHVKTFSNSVILEPSARMLK